MGLTARSTTGPGGSPVCRPLSSPTSDISRPSASRPLGEESGPGVAARPDHHVVAVVEHLGRAEHAAEGRLRALAVGLVIAGGADVVSSSEGGLADCQRTGQSGNGGEKGDSREVTAHGMPFHKSECRMSKFEILMSQTDRFLHLHHHLASRARSLPSARPTISLPPCQARQAMSCGSWHWAVTPPVLSKTCTVPPQ